MTNIIKNYCIFNFPIELHIYSTQKQEQKFWVCLLITALIETRFSRVWCMATVWTNTSAAVNIFNIVQLLLGLCDAETTAPSHSDLLLIRAHMHDEQIKLKVDSPWSQFANEYIVQLYFHMYQSSKGCKTATCLFNFISGNAIVLPTIQHTWRQKLKANWTLHDNSFKEWKWSVTQWPFPLEIFLPPLHRQCWLWCVLMYESQFIFLNNLWFPIVCRMVLQLVHTNINFLLISIGSRLCQ